MRWALALLALTSCSRVKALVGEPPAPEEGGVRPKATPAPPPPPASSAPRLGSAIAFPGAEGFGASAQGGRAGAVCKVTSLANAGAGSLRVCLEQAGPRTVVFAVSGVIDGPLEIKHGRLTIAGQTSPGGIVVKGGVVCDNVYDPNDCNDVIVRHVRFRGGAPDSFRIGGAHDVILDHCSFASAEDENVEITRSRNVTIQHSMIAEPRGEHYQWGGVLINYSKDVFPLQGITIHHTAWNGVAGRLPEMSCEDNEDGAGRSNCNGHVLSIELSNNVLWDASDPIWFNRCTGNNQGNDCPPNAPSFALKLNLVGNLLARRSSADADAPLADPALFTNPKSAIFVADNVLQRGATKVAYAGKSIPARHPFPAVTYTPAASIAAVLAKTAGAFPRDKMDERLASYLSLPIDSRPPAWKEGKGGIDSGDSFAGRAAPPPPPDTDGDGIADVWEREHGLDPAAAADGASIGKAKGCAAGFTALECYVNELADRSVR